MRGLWTNTFPTLFFSCNFRKRENAREEYKEFTVAGERVHSTINHMVLDDAHAIDSLLSGKIYIIINRAEKDYTTVARIPRSVVVCSPCNNWICLNKSKSLMFLDQYFF